MRKNLSIYIKKLPPKPGVYFFKNKKGETLYIGKAGSLKTRVKSYFQKPLDKRLVSMVENTDKIDFRKTDSVLEALILESKLIKKYQPKYNIREKDDKSFLYIVITRENWPRVLLMRESDLKGTLNDKIIFGPYTSGKSLKIALKILRKIFPFRDKCKPNSAKPCFNAQIGLCPGVCTGEISKNDYKKIIVQIKMFLSGKKKRLVSAIKKQMTESAKQEKYELATRLRNRLYALQHIHDIALLDNDIMQRNNKIPYRRIEAYDISNISGQYATGSMVVFENGIINKNEYRRFKIRIAHQADDIAMLKEVLKRRLKHEEWRYPDLIIIDGGRGQMRGVLSVLRQHNSKIPVIAIAKYKKDHLFKSDKNINKVCFSRKAQKIRLKKRLVQEMRNEAHRFAIKYHRFLREKIPQNQA